MVGMSKLRVFNTVSKEGYKTMNGPGISDVEDFNAL